MNNIGVYKIENLVNGHKYVGSAGNIKKRWRAHVNDLRLGKHHSLYLQRAFDKYGEGNFTFSIIIECQSKDELIENEQKIIDLLSPEYNICKVAGSPLGIKHTEETRKKISASLVGNKNSQGKVHTDEWKVRMAEIMRGNKHSLGVKQSDESKEKKRIACTGQHLGSKPWLGRKHTQEEIEKIRSTHIGKKFTEEHKQHLRDSWKKRKEMEIGNA